MFINEFILEMNFFIVTDQIENWKGKESYGA